METPRPFELEYTPQIAELMSRLNISLAISTYQAGKVVFVSPIENDKLIQLARNFKNAMGMCVDNDKIAISTGQNVELLKRNTNLAKIYPQKKNVYDAIYMPRATYHTGYLALHDMSFLDNKIVAVNTMFSCLSTINENESFTPFWQPPFITELLPEDRCHLNGLAIENGEIKYLTALGSTDIAHGWRDKKTTDGILMEYPSGKIILDNLSMPHSPRIFNGKLYLLNSAQGELIEVNPKTGHYEVVVNLGGFARGMDIIGEYLFIGVSKLRHNSQVFRDLPIAKTSFSGFIVVHLPYKSIVGQVVYKMSVDEIYDVKVLKNVMRPNILSTDMDVIKSAITFDDKYFWGKLIDESKVQQTNQPPQKNEAQKKIQIQFLNNMSNKDIIDQFGNMVCFNFAEKLKKGSITSDLHLMLASENMNPIALIIFDAKQNHTSNINSVFVKKEFRNGKIASQMLLNLTQMLKQNKINYIEAEMPKDKTDNEIVNKLFSKFQEINLIFE